MARGGKREGSGRPSDFAEKQKAELYRSAVEGFMDQATAALPEVSQALLDLARGAKELRYVRRSARERTQILKEEECVDGDGEECWLYTLLPDKTALLALVEHTKGRAAQTARVDLDTTIVLQHQIPRAAKPAWDDKYKQVTGEEEKP
jgi:hypothetical protein